MVNKPFLRRCFSLGVPYMWAPVDWSFNHQRRTFPAPIRRWIPPNRPAQDDVPKISQKRCAHAPQSTGSSTWCFLWFLENIYIYIHNPFLNLSWRIFWKCLKKIAKKRLVYLTCWILFSNILEVNIKKYQKIDHFWSGEIPEGEVGGGRPTSSWNLKIPPW